MPVHWELRGRLLILAFSGIVEREEIEAALAAALADPRFGCGRGLLWDGRASQTPLSAEDLTWRFELVASLTERGLVRRSAALVTERWRATLDYFRGQAGQISADLRFEMFVDEKEAHAWLESEDPSPS